MGKQFNVEQYEKRRALYLDAILREASKHDDNATLSRLHQFDGAPVNDVYVLVSNWNKDELQALENTVSVWETTYHVRAAFEDEIHYCDNCGQALYARPASYGAPLSWVMLPDGYTILCRSCFTESELDTYVNQHAHALPRWALDVARGAGFIRLADEYETGFHPGQTDNPAAELKKLMDSNPGREFIPYIVDVGQFDVTWSFLARVGES